MTWIGRTRSGSYLIILQESAEASDERFERWEGVREFFYSAEE